MASLNTTSVDRVMTRTPNIIEDYHGTQVEKKTESSIPAEVKDKRMAELVVTRLAANNLTDEYVERVEVRGHSSRGEQTYLGTDFYGKSEVPFLSTFRHAPGSELLIAAKRSDKVFFTKVKVKGDTAIDINVEKGGIVAEVYSLDSKKGIRGKKSRVMETALVLNECSAQSIDGIHPLM
ncbi:MAG: hypothetical protein KFB93_08710 [Simkaniaceae bacterium]|nr:MAG: hypothetical protein KFB93_08710 [Simkaniaceae bacterium]